MAVALIDQGQALAISPQPRVALDEIIFAQPKVLGDCGDFPVADFHLARPAAALGAALALIFDFGRHVIGGGISADEFTTVPLVDTIRFGGQNYRPHFS